ncbi:hypothetical protein L226DRAFT_568935 [Lentinus tigrinus ALCF2SS1-7]|uniref:Uncharacterized protein n=1 Tax=Lentinus tigrinus ALCF2SS1-6 TaxID=1328759 RepID=A0A5C2SET5_9APHY|nr:hypothetical protein L227DRAFT_609502 [Lentinus tigrinus ALCF2SS1-6]RPD77960.1 hypothetical protein L226DRAFT_568935 [Lentinus tigrinus ALCF2SS1-7]
MSFLPAVNLSSLLRTCRHFLEIGTPSLCLQAGNEPIESAQHTLSFRDFLRVGTPESRDSHVVSLWFRLPERSGFDTRTSTSQRPEHWNAVLTILYNCRGLRSLRIDTWDIRIDPIIVLNAALTSLKSLEDLSIALTPDLAEELLRLSLIGLRRLSIQWPKSERSLDLRRTILWSIRPLAKTLVELNNVIPRDVKTRFSLVHTLGLAMDRSATLIHDAVRTFPNVTRLTLHSAHHHRCHWDREGPAEDNAYRKENKSRWSLDYPRAWPSLTAMWAEDLCGAYCLGMVRSVRAMSLPLTLDSRFYMLPTIVAEMQPRFLELRVDLDDPRICTGILDRLRMPNWSWLSDPANASLSHLTLVMEGLDRVPVYATYHTEAKLVLEGFALALRNAFLTHLLLRYPGRQDVEAISADALLCVTRLAKASPTLCWIGVETIAAGLLCWDVSRTQVAGETDQDQAMDTTLVKMHGEMGARVLEREGIDQFRYVRL